MQILPSAPWGSPYNFVFCERLCGTNLVGNKTLNFTDRATECAGGQSPKDLGNQGAHPRRLSFPWRFEKFAPLPRDRRHEIRRRHLPM
jgi:hypothetical protein